MTPRRPRSLFVRFSIALHAAAAAAVVAAPRLWPIAAGAVLADHLVAVAASLSPRSGLLGPNVTQLDDVAAARGEVALTFDDGPDPRATPAVLELLDSRGARASFFCIGRRARAEPELVRAIVAAGHTIENHTEHHSNLFCFYGPRRLAGEIDRAQRSLAAGAGRLPGWFRAPAGLRNPWLDRVLASRGLELVSWTRRGYDAVDSNADRVLRRLTRGLSGGDVLLLHDGSSAPDASGRPVVLRVLPRVLDELERRGLTATALPRRSGGAGPD